MHCISLASIIFRIREPSRTPPNPNPPDSSAGRPPSRAPRSPSGGPSGSARLAASGPTCNYVRMYVHKYASTQVRKYARTHVKYASTHARKVRKYLHVQYIHIYTHTCTYRYDPMTCRISTKGLPEEGRRQCLLGAVRARSLLPGRARPALYVRSVREPSIRTSTQATPQALRPEG